MGQKKKRKKREFRADVWRIEITNVVVKVVAFKKPLTEAQARSCYLKGIYNNDEYCAPRLIVDNQITAIEDW